MIEPIRSGAAVLAYVIRVAELPPRTTFYTPDDASLQVGHVVHPEGHRIPRHRHRPMPRSLSSTAEVLLVHRGRCIVDFYGEESEPVATRELAAGDIVVLLAGGHGFRMLEDAVLLEVKQGPYVGEGEKEFF